MVNYREKLESRQLKDKRFNLCELQSVEIKSSAINPNYIYDLTPSNQKSYYGKAKILETDSGYYLMSYATVVCYITRNKALLVKLWNDYSLTTSKHINDFLKFYGLRRYSKREWLELPYSISINPLVEERGDKDV